MFRKRTYLVSPEFTECLLEHNYLYTLVSSAFIAPLQMLWNLQNNVLSSAYVKMLIILPAPWLTLGAHPFYYVEVLNKSELMDILGSSKEIIHVSFIFQLCVIGRVLYMLWIINKQFVWYGHNHYGLAVWLSGGLVWWLGPVDFKLFRGVRNYTRRSKIDACSV